MRTLLFLALCCAVSFSVLMYLSSSPEELTQEENPLGKVENKENPLNIDTEKAIKELVPAPGVNWNAVKDELREVGARRKGNHLETIDGKEIVFLKPHHWGNPPANYREIMQAEEDEVRRLGKYPIRLPLNKIVQ